jgi:hypothetical protein
MKESKRRRREARCTQQHQQSGMESERREASCETSALGLGAVAAPHTAGTPHKDAPAESTAPAPWYSTAPTWFESARSRKRRSSDDGNAATPGGEQSDSRPSPPVYGAPMACSPEPPAESSQHEEAVSALEVYADTQIDESPSMARLSPPLAANAPLPQAVCPEPRRVVLAVFDDDEQEQAAVPVPVPVPVPAPVPVPVGGRGAGTQWHTEAQSGSETASEQSPLPYG